MFGLFVDTFVFDISLAAIESFFYTYARTLARFIYFVRSIKQAGIQE